MRVIFLSLMLLVLVAGSSTAATHAIIIGIDNYTRHPKLLGAVNDARDLEKTLKPRVDGVFEVLIDEQATRANFDNAWKQILDSAQVDDLLIFSFSGHGVTQADDNDFRDEIDGLDELLLFQPFDEQPGSGFTEEYLLDDELFDLFKQAEKKKLKILFIADACHSGGLARAVGDLEISKTGLPYRFTKLGGQSPVRPESTEEIVKKPEIPDNVAFLSATNERMRLQEVLIEKQPRGALSYYVARAIEGHADKNKDNVITDDELKQFVIQNVRAKASQRQIPEMITSKINQQLIIVDKTHKTIKPETEVPPPEKSGIRLFVKKSNQLPNPIDGAIFVNSVAAAEVIFDPADGRLFNAFGDMLSEDMSFASLPAAIEAMRVRNFLLDRLGKGHLLEIDLKPDDRLYTADCHVIFQVKNFNYRHFTVVDLVANGQLQFLFPIIDPNRGLNDPLLWKSSHPWEIKNRVSEPFGADFLIFIASERPLIELHKQLELFGATMRPQQFLELLASGLEDQKYQIGLRGTYTSRKGNPCPQ